MSDLPEVFQNDTLLGPAANELLNIITNVQEFNDKYLPAESTSDSKPEHSFWSLINEGKKFATSGDANLKPLVDELETVQTRLNLLRKSIVEKVCEQKGIVPPQAKVEIPSDEKEQMSELRKRGVALSSTLATLAEVLTDPTAKNSVLEWLSANPVPAVGSRRKTDPTSSITRHRVVITVHNSDGEVIFHNDKGFSQALLARDGKKLLPDANAMRQAYESNTAEGVQFEHNGNVVQILPKPKEAKD